MCLNMSCGAVYSRPSHNSVISSALFTQLAFMSDDEAAARGGDSMKMEFMGSGGAPPMASGVHTMPSPGGGGMSDSFGNPYGDPGVLPWWHREPGAPPVMGMSSFGAGRGGGGGGGGIGVGGVSGDGFNDAFTFSAHMGGGGSRNQHEGGGGGIEGGRSSSRGGGVRLDERRSEYACQTSTRDVHRHMNGGGGGGGAGADAGSVSHDGIGSSSMPNFRTSSGLVRLPGLMSPAAGNMEGQPGLGGRGLKLPSPGSILAGIPGANAARVGSGCATPSGGVEDPPRRPISPMTIGPSQRVQGGMSNGGTGGGGGGVIKRPPHFLPLPQHHPSDSIEKQIAELTALNDILFGPDQEDAHALLLHQQQQLQLQQQQLRQQHQHAHEHGHAHVISSPPGGSRGGGIERGGTVDGPKGVFAPPNSNAPDRIARSNGGGHHRFDGGVVDGGDGGVEGEGGGGRLPSIAGLVAAGALLSGEKPGSRWRSCRQGETMLVRGRTGEV